MTDVETRYHHLCAVLRSAVNDLEADAKLLDFTASRLTGVAATCSETARALRHTASSIASELGNE